MKKMNTSYLAVWVGIPIAAAVILVVLALGLLIHLKQSRVCAVLLLAYSLFNCVVMLLSTGRFSGWLIILAGVFAVIYTFQLEKAYQEFRGN